MLDVTFRQHPGVCRQTPSQLYKEHLEFVPQNTRCHNMEHKTVDERMLEGVQLASITCFDS